ncbi:MAG: PorV/PorQ family protein [Candidatus Zixiibacteriota bacterium]
MKHRLVIVALILLVLCLPSVYAGNSKRIGTAGAQELLIPIGSRGTAMGGTTVADASGVEAMYWNPAGLASLEGTEAMFSHQPYIADIDINFGGVATNIESFGAIGLGAKVVSIGDMEETTQQFPDGTGRVFNPTLTVLGLTYARQLTANVSFGATGMLINETIFEATSNATAFDVGFIYDPRWRGVKMGIAVKNYGPQAKFSGKGFERFLTDQRPTSPNAASYDLPSSINIGISYNAFNQGMNSVTLAGNFRSNNFQEDMWQGGAEYAYNQRYFLRAGYNYSKQDQYLYGASVGAGLSYPIGSTKLTFEYAWTQTETFDDNQYFTLRANF